MKKYIALFFLGLLIGCEVSTVYAQQSWYTTPKELDATDDEIIDAINQVEDFANGIGWHVDSTLSKGNRFAFPSQDSHTIGAPSNSRGFQALSSNTPHSRSNMALGLSPSYGLKTRTQGRCYADDTSGPAWDSLDQIVPHPIYEPIRINYAVDGQFPNTYIRIVTLEGFEKDKYPIQKTGKGHLLIPGNTFTNGIFLYELIVDGEMVASREMVLTK